MPYNTRRKSLSLPSLGIHLPNASRSNRSSSASKIPATTENQPPSKKVKRSHDSESQSPSGTSSNGQISLDGRNERLAAAYGHTPPPSPADTGIVAKINTEGINDDIIVAVIEQLEKTGNRPHLIKELATVLSSINDTIANSANAAALISSRLSLYLKRPWTALAPCPIAKEQIPVHPRKVFFYLTNSTPQPLPEDSSDIISPPAAAKQITPSLSNASIDLDDSDEALERARMSPSPEVDLSSPAFEHEETGLSVEHSTPGRPPTPTGSYSVRSRMAHNYRISHSSRAVSPPLEGDEKEFTLTASSVRERTSAEDSAAKQKDSSASEGGAEGDVSRDEVNMDDCFVSHGSHPQNHEYGYFPSHLIRSEDHVDAADAQVLGTSPSPSISSELSSLSSVSSTASEAAVDDCAAMSPVVSLEPILSPGKTKGVSGCKRSLEMIDAGFGLHIDAALDSWLDLQSPEAVEIHELDAIFADI
ncbi:hypothetical protein D8B26_003083 [Coccidioides posadasii str. Silveira]|uniref:GDS1 winged helix domain-containing protein n=3 Tax=Coccidioides posadasii TaxID=199306 RepID=E9CZB6_COCPS|nr:hypothetical protein CPC735_007020 [Coccidioides posadasii C735 delta SOWgp]EER26530.1 hypothetical protein CPC735_007020 [Coccidioides posadasii C735 delta SOWgp]EFW20560.1 conserved hypothetical protein [Coccidioides posadasii str. Silveira]KMM72875.1 hypothetical protein CPAG_09165 [Coccidioides posadasii RMSCC 3488]QVM08391.1 hypothetical protein D8B26_003083 [Coccidioides posadasii str. Silveira]|eukprot:XP_003068675.1 hypothetical protein CPC735_007020 [Coccidioides posadasii C735 delta SOWgp]